MKERSIAVIDLKAFYSYVECLDRNLDPFSTPLVVADKDRGKNTIVLSVSPYLKAHGVPSRLRINDLPKEFDYIYATPRMERYIEKSSEVMSIFMDVISEEDIHIYSIDEAFLDLTSYLHYYEMSPRELVKYIINIIKDKTGLFATAGIGDNFFLAKVALDNYAKKEKDGIYEIRMEDVNDKVWPITPLSNIWGIGERLEARLNKLGIYTMKDLATSNKDFMIKHFGVIGEQLRSHANGIDEADIHEKYLPHETSLSIGQALFKNYTKDEAELIIKEMVDDLSIRLRMIKSLTGVVSIYIMYAKNGGFARQIRLNRPTDDNDTIIESLLYVYRKNVQNEPIRRIGINYSRIIPIPKYEQLDLFIEPNIQSNARRLNQVIDDIKAKFGPNSILRASSLLSYSTVKERHAQIGGHRR